MKFNGEHGNNQSRHKCHCLPFVIVKGDTISLKWAVCHAHECNVIFTGVHCAKKCTNRCHCLLLNSQHFSNMKHHKSFVCWTQRRVIDLCYVRHIEVHPRYCRDHSTAVSLVSLTLSPALTPIHKNNQFLLVWVSFAFLLLPCHPVCSFSLPCQGRRVHIDAYIKHGRSTKEKDQLSLLSCIKRPALSSIFNSLWAFLPFTVFTRGILS